MLGQVETTNNDCTRVKGDTTRMAFHSSDKPLNSGHSQTVRNDRYFEVSVFRRGNKM